MRRTICTIMSSTKYSHISHLPASAAVAAPLFDHGNSLFNFAGPDCWTTEAALQDYVDTLQPAVYDDFIGMAKKMMTDRSREQLRHLLTFKFTKHPTHNIPLKRRRMIERQIQRRARLLLE